MICRTLKCLPGSPIVVAIGDDAAVLINRVGDRMVELRILAPRAVPVRAASETQPAAEAAVARVKAAIARAQGGVVAIPPPARPEPA